jgi:hypothetical protein
MLEMLGGSHHACRVRAHIVSLVGTTRVPALENSKSQHYGRFTMLTKRLIDMTFCHAPLVRRHARMTEKAMIRRGFAKTTARAAPSISLGTRRQSISHGGLAKP